MISLRLSAEEYEAIHALYPAYGARSVSEFARMAIRRAISQPAPAAGTAKIQQLDERLSAVEERLARLFQRDKVPV
jgi:hypothetical protein